MSSSHYAVSPDGKVPLKVTPDGPASIPPITAVEALKRTVARHKNRLALAVKRGGKWQTWTYGQYYEDIKLAAKSLIRLGLKPQHSVCIIGFNSPEWFIADIACIMAGGFAAGIYTTNNAEACHFVASDARANVIVVEDEKQLKKILEIRSRLPELKAIVQYTGTVAQELKSDGVYEWADFMRVGVDMPDYELQWRITPQEPGNCCTLIYTSGTTGNPKAVMVSHDNLTWTARTVADMLSINHEDVALSYLPLSHIAAQMVDVHAPLLVGCAVYFAQPDALKGSLSGTLKEVRPTYFLGVPRVWEKIMEKMQAVGRQTTGLKAKIAAWAKEIGTESNQAIQEGKDTVFGHWLASKLVFSKVKEALGLDRCRFMATAAAPIARDVLDYFLSLDMPLYEVYGMSECTGPETISIPGKHRTGSCGPPVPGTELKIMNPDEGGNGEVCFRGRHIFMGYLMNEEKTKEAIDADGFLHSGDIGKLDERGFLTITGRIKELVITAGGENVAPVPIEDNVKSALPIVSNCMVIGDRMKFLSLLVSLRTTLDAEGHPQDTLAPEVLSVLATIGSTAKTVQEAQTCAKIKEHITKGIEKANKLAVSNAQKLQKFSIVPIDFSIQGGELGPTLKLRRNIVAQKYADLIKSMYAESATDV